jgi:hypothetical protein
MKYTFCFQTFFKDHMGVDLYMEPNFEDYSCQVKQLPTFNVYYIVRLNRNLRPVICTFHFCALHNQKVSDNGPHMTTWFTLLLIAVQLWGAPSTS